MTAITLGLNQMDKISENQNFRLSSVIAVILSHNIGFLSLWRYSDQNVDLLKPQNGSKARSQKELCVKYLTVLINTFNK